MAEIRPFRAWRYNNFFTPLIGELTAPLFDVVSEQQRLKLYQNPHNSIHLSVPLVQNEGKKAGEIALNTLKNWKNEGIITQDEKPAIYIYYQYFSLADQPQILCRKGFICFLRVYDWQENVLLRHENTIPSAVNDRTELLEKTLLNASPTHGIYTDEALDLEKYMDEAIKNPIYETEDYQGVKDVLAKIEEEKIIKIFVNHLKDKQLILADGHHRYESSLVLKQKKSSQNPAHTGEEGYNFHLIFLTNSASDDLKILPTHRLWKGAIDGVPFSNDFIKKLEQYFIVGRVDNPSDLNEIICGKKWTFGLIMCKDTENKNLDKDIIAFKLSLKSESLETLDWDFPLVIKELDLTILHYFVFQKVIGIEGKDQRNSPNIGYERNFTECLTQVLQGKARAAFIVNPVQMDEVQKVCQSGYTLPQKSTYFYPKVISGFVFGDIS
jgi:uncharacterized protein (DUF1015 family)